MAKTIEIVKVIRIGRNLYPFFSEAGNKYIDSFRPVEVPLDAWLQAQIDAGLVKIIEDEKPAPVEKPVPKTKPKPKPEQTPESEVVAE